MSQLRDAMEACLERKMAVTGTAETGEPEIVYSRGELDNRAMFSGFDIDYGELKGSSLAVGDFYAENARLIGLRPLFVSCWCDGLLTGLMLASLPSESSAPDTDDGVGPEGENPDEL